MREYLICDVKKLWVVLLLFSLLQIVVSLPFAAAVDASSFSYIKPKERVMAPGFTLPSYGDEEKSLSDYKGKVILLNFWSTTCVACREEMPALQRLSDKVGVEGFEVIGINVDRRSERTVKKFMQRSALSFVTLLDRNGQVRKEYEVMLLPVSYIIDRDGFFIGKVIGMREWDNEEEVRFFKGLVDGENK